MQVEIKRQTTIHVERGALHGDEMTGFIENSGSRAAEAVVTIVADASYPVLGRRIDGLDGADLDAAGSYPKIGVTSR